MKILKKIYISIWVKPFDTFFSFLIKNSNVRNNVFIRMDLLGDNFVFFPFLLKYNELYPNSLWIVNELTSPLYFCMGLKHLPVDRRKFVFSPLYRFSLLKNLLSSCFDLAVNFSPHRSQWQADEILRLLRANEKVCYGNDSIAQRIFDNKICDKVITYDYGNTETYPYIHIFDHEKNFFQKLTGVSLNIDIVPWYKKALRNLKERLNYSFSFGKYIVIIPDASLPIRRFPIKRWQSILAKLSSKLKIIQLGINKFYLTHPNLIDLSGKTSLRESMAIVMNSSLVIGNETGLTHLAYLSGVPTVCILGGGHFGRFLPWLEFSNIVRCVYTPMECFRCGWRCKYVSLGQVPPCISSISSDMVLGAIESLNEDFKVF